MALKSNMTGLVSAREKFKREIVLLSHGYSCPEAFPDGLCTIYPWDTTVDEWLMARRKKGGSSVRQIFYELVAQLVKLGPCPIEKFVVGDINTVLLVSRSILHDSRVQYLATCPKCGTTEKAMVTVPDGLEKIGEKSAAYPGFDQIVLPVCADVVKIRPLLIKDQIEITGRQDKSISDHLAETLTSVIDVNDTTPDSLKELTTWFMALHPRDQMFIQTSQGDLFPHLNQAIAHRCDECGKDYEFNLEIDDEFFRSRGAAVH